MNLKEIKKINWKYLVSRREAILCKSITTNPGTRFKKLTGLPWTVKNRLHFSDGDVFRDVQELASLKKIFLQNNSNNFLKFKKSLISNINKLDKYTVKISKIDFTNYNQSELFKKVVKYFEFALNGQVFLEPMAVADKLLSEEILKKLPAAQEKVRQAWLSILTFPDKENIHTYEEQDFYKLVNLYKKDKKDFYSHLLKHLKKYAWIGSRGYWFERAWTLSMIRNRILNLLSQKKDPIKELKYLQQARIERQQEYRNLVKKLKIAKKTEFYNLIKISKEFAYLRTWRTDVIYRAGYLVHELFFEIAKRAKFNIRDLPYLSYLELITMARKARWPLSRDIIRKRKRYNVNVLLNGEFTVLSGASWYKKIKKIVSKKVSPSEKIEGQTAFPGKVKGRVKIVFSTLDLNKVKKRDILVAIMTFPHFVPAMEKAAAFVTDEGGILCHAAIVAREMRKPCVIGTKIATKVLKDGERVEVDANKGIVKKVK